MFTIKIKPNIIFTILIIGYFVRNYYYIKVLKTILLHIKIIKLTNIIYKKKSNNLKMF